MAEIKIMNLGAMQRYDEKIKAYISDADEEVLSDAKGYADSLADNYDAAGTAATKVQELADGQVKTNADAIAAINNEESGILAQAKDYADGKDEAINAAKTAADAAQTDVDALEERFGVVEGEIGDLEGLGTTAKADLVTAINEVRNSVSAGGTAAAITIDTSTTTDGALKTYTIKQGENTVGTIDIPKDMVVESGEVVTNPEGQAEGTYIKLVLANVTEPLYVNVGTLVDIYKAKADATQIQIVVDSATREISATIVNGSVGTDALADNAITTVKIADANVTLAKLSTTVQTSLGKADSAVQTVAEGSANGTIAVDGTDVTVKGLGSAAYTDASAYEAAGAAQALADGQVATNTAAIEALQATTYVEITTDEIDALFA